MERRRIENDDVSKSTALLDTQQLHWQYFDEKGYIDKTRLLSGQDAYAKNKFNQAASDRIKSNRDIPDTRHPR